MNGFTALLQAKTCLYLLLGGVGAGLLYDALLPLRRGSAPVRAAADTLFALLSAAVCFLALSRGGADSARPYVAVAFFLGLFLWRVGPRRGISAIFRALSRKRRARVEEHKKDMS